MPSPNRRSEIKVSVVIVNLNGRKVLPGLLNSLTVQTFRSFETILVDNASSDGSVEYVEENFGVVKLKTNSRNLGYARGLNQGIMEARGEYLLLLNNDVELEANTLEELVRVMEERPEIGVVQPKIKSFSERDTFDYAGAAGGMIDVLCYPFCRGRIFETIEQDYHQYDNPCYIFWAGGAAFMVRKEILGEVGPFDEDFYMYHEETDLCWRVNLAGYRVAFTGSASVYHRGSYTFASFPSEVRYFYMHRNILYLILKCESGRRIFLTLVGRSSFEIVNIVYSLVVGRSNEARAIVKGMFSALRHLPLMLRKRSLLGPLRNKGSLKMPIYPRLIVMDYFIGGKISYRSLFE